MLKVLKKATAQLNADLLGNLSRFIKNSTVMKTAKLFSVCLTFVVYGISADNKSINIHYCPVNLDLPHIKSFSQNMLT